MRKILCIVMLLIGSSRANAVTIGGNPHLSPATVQSLVGVDAWSGYGMPDHRSTYDDTFAGAGIAGSSGYVKFTSNPQPSPMINMKLSATSSGYDPYGLGGTYVELGGNATYDYQFKISKVTQDPHDIVDQIRVKVKANANSSLDGYGFDASRTFSQDSLSIINTETNYYTVSKDGRFDYDDYNYFATDVIYDVKMYVALSAYVISGQVNMNVLVDPYFEIAPEFADDYNISFSEGVGNKSQLSPVPLPASAPMFGAALLGLAGIGYAAKRKKAVAGA